MPSILSMALFASSAAAQLTTSIWLPGASNANQTFVGSVIAQNGDQTTLLLAFQDGPATESDYYRSAPDTVTVGGTTKVAFQATGSDSSNEAEVTVTISLACERKDASAVPTCTMSTSGLNPAISALCAGLKSESLGTPVGEAPYCTDPAALTTEQTLTLSGESQNYLNNFPLIITAGTEKLGASAAATPTASGASATGSGSARAASGSGVAGASQTGPRASGAAQQSTAAAAPLKTMAPALAGLGAAAAAFFL